MFSMCSELTPRAPIPDTRIPQLMQPCVYDEQCDDDNGVFVVKNVTTRVTMMEVVM